MQDFLHVKPCPQATYEKRKFFLPPCGLSPLVVHVCLVQCLTVDWLSHPGSRTRRCKRKYGTSQEWWWVGIDEIYGSVRPMKCNINLKWPKCMFSIAPKLSPSLNVASFPGLVHSLLAVRNLPRFRTASDERAGPGKRLAWMSSHYKKAGQEPGNKARSC